MTRANDVAGTARTPVQIAALLVAAVFLLVGVLGFVPGVTTHYGAMNAAGHRSGALLLGLFAVSVLHNVVHLAFGVAGFALARTARLARYYLIGGGVVYLILFAYGLSVDDGSTANVVPLNAADDWLHLALAIAMIALGALLGTRASRPSGTASRQSAEREGRVQ